MRRFRILVILAWFLAPGVPAQAAEIPAARDFAADAQVLREQRVPLLVVFDSPGCSYCRRVMREFLEPLQKNDEYRAKVIMRRVGIKARARLVDFAGQPTTQRQYAQRQAIKLVPTVLLLDAEGQPLTPPLVGLSTPDFYGSYLEAAIDAAYRKMRGEPAKD